jgi:hypothetical protein
MQVGLAVFWMLEAGSENTPPHGIPESSTMLLLASGLARIGWLRRKFGH